MSGFVFSLAKNTCLQENSEGCFLISEAPVRMLRLNKSLFSTLKRLQEGNELSDVFSHNPGVKKGQLLRTLLSLTSKGYLKLEKTGELGNYPRVSVIIPVRDQPDDLVECLRSLRDMDYPEDKLEIIVVDDGSSEDFSDAIFPFQVRLIRLEKSQGAAAARNYGAQQANGDILAFLDADCVADRNWLGELLPFFEVEGIGAVGGFVDGYYKKSYMDRYEEVSSSLNMGTRLIFESSPRSSFYVPSCNMLVSKKAFLATGGFNPSMHVGEDVDFCWRMKARGFSLLYVPLGRVAHKHRNRLFNMLSRRNDYGTSEATLYSSHKEKRKRFTIPIFAALSLAGLIAAILLRNPYPVFLALLFFGIDAYLKSVTLKRFKVALPFRQIALSAMRSHFSFYYFTSFHVVRYYLILLFGLGFLFHPLWLLLALALLLASIVDYRVKKPELPYPVFLFFYVLEHMAYQTGVFWGCLKLGQFGSYIPSFARSYSTGR